MNLGVIALFAPRDRAKKITEEVVMLYVSIVDSLSQKMESTLYSVLYAMVDAYFDDVNEYWRVMTMLKENTSQESVEKFESVSIFKNRVLELEEVNSIANGKIADLKRANDSAKGEIADLKAEIKNLKSQLANSK